MCRTAIRIAGARLAARAGWTIQTLARRLANERRRLDEFSVGDLAVRACFQVSFTSLPAAGPWGVDPARAFRLLGLWHGPSIGVPAAAALLGRQGEAWVLNNLGIVFSQQHMHDAVGYLERALAIRTEIGDRRGEAQAANNLAFTYQLLGRCDEAVGPLVRTMDIQRQIGHKYGEATTQCNLGEAYLDLGRIPDAIGCIQEALTIAREIGSQRVEAYALNNFGRAQLGLGHDAEAIDLLREALAIHRGEGDKYGEAHALRHLGVAQRCAGHAAEARESWIRACAIFSDLGDGPQAAELRAQLDALGNQ